jgi:hypothetical protein
MAGTRTLDSKKLRSIAEIRFELALFLEVRFGTRIEHRVLIVVRLTIPQSEPSLALGLLLCELLLERSFLLVRNCRCRCGGGRRLLLFVVG